MDIPVIELDGSETWRSGYYLGENLENKFSGQGGYDLAVCCEYNGWGPILGESIRGLLMIVEGERDEQDWIWLITTSLDKSYWCQGGCDYTGWDCQSWNSWDEYHD